MVFRLALVEQFSDRGRSGYHPHDDGELLEKETELEFQLWGAAAGLWFYWRRTAVTEWAAVLTMATLTVDANT